MPSLQYHPGPEIELFKNNKTYAQKFWNLDRDKWNRRLFQIWKGLPWGQMSSFTIFGFKGRIEHDNDTIYGTKVLFFENSRWVDIPLCEYAMYRLWWLLYFLYRNCLVDEMKLDVNDWPWCSRRLPLNQQTKIFDIEFHN